MSDVIRDVWNGFAGAAAFLTVFPAREVGSSPGRVPGFESQRWITLFFPLVGLGLGAGLGALRAVLPADGLVGAALVLAVWTGATGGLHEDGWADCADAALPPVERARRLDILDDPRVGAHGLTALLLLMIVRFAAVADVPGWVLVAPPVVGRWAMVLSLGMATPLRSTGLGNAMARWVRPRGGTAMAVGILAAVATGLVTLGEGWLGGGVTPSTVPLAIAAGSLGGLACAMAVGAFLHARLGGLSGDGHGAVGLAAETGALCAAALLVTGGIL